MVHWNRLLLTLIVRYMYLGPVKNPLPEPPYRESPTFNILASARAPHFPRAEVYGEPNNRIPPPKKPSCFRAPKLFKRTKSVIFVKKNRACGAKMKDLAKIMENKGVIYLRGFLIIRNSIDTWRKIVKFLKPNPFPFEWSSFETQPNLNLNSFEWSSFYISVLATCTTCRVLDRA